LHLAADRGLADVVRLLIERGAALDVVDEEKITPYELVCCGLASPPNVEEIRSILREAGAIDSVFTHIYLGNDQAAIEMIQQNPAIAGAHGPIWFTPLQTAARAGRTAVLKQLLALSAAVDDPRPHACTGLWLACQSAADATSRLEAAELLIHAGADVGRSCDQERSTPLHIAAWRGPSEMVELLLRHGAKPQQPDRHGKTAAHYARRGNAPDKRKIIDLLDPQPQS
jgi:ankyrin repeat protein